MSTGTATLPRFEIQPLSHEGGGGYFVKFLDCPGCIATLLLSPDFGRRTRDSSYSVLRRNGMSDDHSTKPG